MAAVTTALTAFAPSTQAQAYLRSLENKAKNKVIEKIEKNAGKSKESDKPAATLKQANLELMFKPHKEFTLKE